MGNKPSSGGRKSASGSAAGSASGSADRHGRRGSLSVGGGLAAGGGGGGSSAATGPPLWPHESAASPHTYPPGTVLPRLRDYGHHGRHKPFLKYERDMLRSTFADLASRSASGKTIDKETFLKFFCNVPGMLGERLFHTFNSSGSGSLELDEFLNGLASYCRGSAEERVAFLFSMVNLSQSGRISRVELETMVNSFLFVRESIFRKQSAAAAHSAAAEASVAKAAAASAAAAAAEQQRNGAGGVSNSGSGSGPSQQHLLSEHLRQMKSRAHSPSFAYTPPLPAHSAGLARLAAESDAAASWDAGPEGKDDGGGGVRVSLHHRAGSLSIGDPLSNPTLSSFPHPGALAGDCPSPEEDLLSPAHAAEPDWMHSTRVKEMVDDAFQFAQPQQAATSAATATDPTSGHTALSAQSGLARCSSSSANIATPDAEPAGLSVYQFGAWLQHNPSVLDVLDAAFLPKEGLGPNGGLGNLMLAPSFHAAAAAPGDEELQAQQLGHRGFVAVDMLSVADMPLAAAFDGSGGGGGGASALAPRHHALTHNSASLAGELAPSPLPHVLSAHGASFPGCSGGGVAMHHSPLLGPGGAADLSAIGAGVWPLSVSPAVSALAPASSSAVSSKSLDKKTWKDGPRLSISNAVPGPLQLAVGARGPSSLAPPQALRGPHPRFVPAAPQHERHPFCFRCDQCGFEITVRFCMGCGKQLVPVAAGANSGASASAAAAAATSGTAPSNSHPSITATQALPSAQPSHSSFTAAPPSASFPVAASSPLTPAPAAGAASAVGNDYACAHCSVQLFGCGVPRFCLCCGGEVRWAPSASAAGAAHTAPPPSILGGWGGMHPRGVGSSLSLVGAAPQSQPAAAQQSIVEGYLKKVGARLKNVISRWFVIRDSFMYEHMRPSDVVMKLRPAHVIFLAGCFVEPVNHEDRSAKLRYGIEIVLNEEARKSRFLYASSAESRQQWIDAIRVHANVHDIEESYLIGPELGVGRFSSVREGVSKASGRRYAIKIIDKAEIGLKEREALRTEVAVLKLVNHPNIIRLKQVFETRRQIFIVMTFVKGGDLFDRLVKRKRFPEATVQALMLQLLQVVQYLHVRGIVHRDLKPENVMMVSQTDDTAIMLADFGLGAFALPDQSMSLPCGTLTFTAPEVLIGKGYGMEVDLWSLGVIFFLLIRGRLPFDGKTADEIRERTIAGRFVMDEHPSWVQVSPECKDVIRGLLTVDPAQRLNCAQAIDHPFFKLNLQKNAETTASAATVPDAAAGGAGVATDAAATANATASTAPSADGTAPASAHGPSHSQPVDASASATTARSNTHLLPPALPLPPAGANSASSLVVSTPSATPVVIGPLLPSPVVGSVDSRALLPVPASAAAASAAPPVTSPITAAELHRLRMHASASPSYSTPGVPDSSPTTPAPSGARRGVAEDGTGSARGSVTNLPSLVVPGSCATSPHHVGVGGATGAGIGSHSSDGDSDGSGDDDDEELEPPRMHEATEEEDADAQVPLGTGAAARAGVESPSSAISPITILRFPASTPGGRAGDASAAGSSAASAAADDPAAPTTEADVDGDRASPSGAYSEAEALSLDGGDADEWQSRISPSDSSHGLADSAGGGGGGTGRLHLHLSPTPLTHLVARSPQSQDSNFPLNDRHSDDEDEQACHGGMFKRGQASSPLPD